MIQVGVHWQDKLQRSTGLKRCIQICLLLCHQCHCCGTDKKRHTHTEMRWDTPDEEQHTCPMFDTLMANVSHLFRNVCQILSTWYHTISINSATMFPFWIVRKSNVICDGRISHYLCTSYTVHTLCKSSVVKSKSAFPCWSKIWDYKFYSLNYYTSSYM